MTEPFMFLRVDEFPELGLNESVRTKVQVGMPWGDSSAETSITYLGVADDDRFERYSIVHQVERHVDAVYNHEPIRRLLENRRFHAFYRRDVGRLFVSTSGSNARRAFERLGTANPPIQAHVEHINLLDVMSLGKTTGAYFGALRIDKVRSAAVFGTTTVVESEEFSHYAQLGDLTVIYIQIMSDDGDIRKLQLLTDRGVVLFNDLGERLNLQFVDQIQDSIDAVRAAASGS